MQSLRGLFIGADSQLATELESVLLHVTSALSLRKVKRIPSDTELESMVQLYAPAIVFLDMADSDAALHLADLVHHHAPGVQIIGIAAEATRETLFAAVRSGMRDVLSRPLVVTDVHRALTRIYRFVEENPQPASHRQRILSFLPAKVGSGASTVALHTAFTMSRFGSARIALMDFDFDCGVIDFMLKLPYSPGMSDVAEYGSRLDESIWSRVVTRFGNLDVLRAGNPQPRVNSNHTGHILNFARRSYDVICVDLPGAFDESAISVFEQSHSIFIVCTPDLPSLHLARRRLELLREMNLGDRAHVIYNCYNPKAVLSKEAVEDVLGTEVFAVIDNDWAALQTALVNGRPLDLDTPLGRNFTRITHKILGVDRQNAGGKPSSIWANLRNLFFPSQSIPPKSPGRKPLAQLPAPRCAALVPLREAAVVEELTAAH